ncbi:MAG: hypothetical protein ACXVWF_08510 [Actinomycetota bacterium]
MEDITRLPVDRCPRFYAVEEYDEPGFPPVQIVAEYLGFEDAGRDLWLPLLGADALSRHDLAMTPSGLTALARWQEHDDIAFSAFHRLRAQQPFAAVERAAKHPVRRRRTTRIRIPR